MHEGERLRPLKRMKYNANFTDLSVEFELDHHQLWQIDKIKDGKCYLNNSSYTMKMVLAENNMDKIFDMNQSKT